MEPVTIPVLYRTLFGFAKTVVGVVNVIAAIVVATRSFFIVVVSLLKNEILFCGCFWSRHNKHNLPSWNYFWALKKSLSNDRLLCVDKTNTELSLILFSPLLHFENIRFVEVLLLFHRFH